MREASQDDTSEAAPAARAAKEELRLVYALTPPQETGQKQKVRHVTCTFPMGDIREVTFQSVLKYLQIDPKFPQRCFQ